VNEEHEFVTGAEATGQDGCFRPAVYELCKYIAGTTTDQVQRELGMTDVAKLASNENPYGPSPRVFEAIQAELCNIWQYPEQSFFDIKHAIAAHNGVDFENVVVGHGSEAIIQLIPQLLVEPGDEVVLADVSYGRHEEASKLMDAVLKRVPLSRYQYDVEAMAAAVTPRTKLVWIASPNNPTGTIVTRAEVDWLLERLPETVTVVFDEAYREYVDDAAYGDGLEYLKAGRDNVVVLRTFSKAYGLAGLRLGYGLLSKRVAWLLDTIKEPFNVNRLSLVAGVAALADHEWLGQVVRSAISGRELLTTELSGLACDVVPSQANFVLADVHRDAAELFECLLRRGVIVRPAGGWGYPTHLRVTVGTPKQNARFLEALREESPR
jgi:histidinol-phosphate aminotransferase